MYRARVCLTYTYIVLSLKSARLPFDAAINDIISWKGKLMSMFMTTTSSNAPIAKSRIREWYERLSGGSAVMTRAKLHAVAGAEALRAGGEAGLVGGMLGAASVMLPNGLDLVVSKTNSKVPKLPIDGALGALLLVGSVAAAGEANAVSHDLRNAGGAAMAVFAFRKSEQYMSKQYRMQGKTPGYQKSSEYQISSGATVTSFRGEDAGFGHESADPILLAAQAL